jgi:hypothetical protein
MREVVLDIETVSNWSALSDGFRADVQRRHDPSTGESAADRCALRPWTGRIVVIGTFDTGTARGEVLYVGEGEPVEHGPFRLVAVRDEAAALARFWELARPAQRAVSWNGYRFDANFLAIRSLACRVPIGKPWWTKWHEPSVHLDVYNVLSGMGAFGDQSAPKLEYVCEAFGLRSPKHDLAGKDVGKAYARGEGLRVARYCADDVYAAYEAYRYVDRYMPPGTKGWHR